MKKIIVLVVLMTYVIGIFSQTFSSQLETKAKKEDVNAQYDLAKQYYDFKSAYSYLSSATNASEPIGDAMWKTAYMEGNSIGTSKNTINVTLLRRDYLKHNFTNEVGALLTESLDYASIPFKIQSVDGKQLVTTNVEVGVFNVQSGPMLKTAPIDPNKSENDETEVYDSVESMLYFPLGETVLMHRSGVNIHYPAKAQENGVEGRVILNGFLGNRVIKVE